MSESLMISEIRVVSFPNGCKIDEKRCKTSAKAADDQIEALSERCTDSTTTKNISVGISLGMKRLSCDAPYVIHAQRSLL